MDTDKALPATAVLNVWFASGLQTTYNMSAQVGANIASEISIGWGGGSATVQVTPTEWINSNQVERYTCVLS